MQGEEAIEKESWFLKLFILAVVFGFVSGIVGGMIVNSRFFDDWLWGEGGAWKSLVSQNTSRQEAKQLSRDNLIRKSTAVVTEIYLNTESNKDGLFVPAQKLASGFFLTSNGYMATIRSLFEKYNKKDLIIVDQERKAYKIEKVVLDPISDLAIVKVQGENFSSAPFMYESDLVIDLDVFLPKLRVGLLADKILAINAFTPQSKADYYLNSEDIYRFGLLKGGFDKNSAGSPLLNSRGEIVGMVFDQSENSGTWDKFIKVGVIESALKKVLDKGAVSRAYLGAHYQEAEFNYNLRGDLKRGIILINDSYHNAPALDKKSPLNVLGIKAGDIILEVAEESLTSWKTLPEILSDYNPGNQIQIKYLRNKEEKTVTVELGNR